MLIPRGGKGLIDNVVKNATVPVIQTGVGNCHVYVDSHADLSMAENIVINAKTQRPAVCNAMETLLVREAVADKLLPSLSEKLFKLGVEIRGCDKTIKIIHEAKPATKEDWEEEFLDLILAVKVVSSLDEALDHIYKYGTKHARGPMGLEELTTNKYVIYGRGEVRK